MTDNRPLLGRLVAGDGRDVLEPVASRGNHASDFDSIVFARYRDGLRVESNHVEVFVTRATHRWGAGIVARVRLWWDREVEPASGPLLSREDALFLAAERLDRRLPSARARLRIACLMVAGARSCRPTWSVFDRSAEGDRPDTVVLHAATGEILQVARTANGASGTVEVNTNWPYDETDVDRPMRFAEIRAYDDYPPNWYTHGEMDEDGAYSFSAPLNYPAIGDANLRSDSLEIRHMEDFDADCSDEDPVLRAVDLDGADTVEYGPDGNYSRTDALAFSWLTYLRTTEPDFSGSAEYPTRIWFDVEERTDRSGMLECDDDEQVYLHLESVSDDDDDDVRRIRNVTAHEYQHSVQWCSETAGAECGFTTDTGVFSGAWLEGQAMVFGDWFGQYDKSVGAARWWMTPYEGPGHLDDIFVHQEEIEEPEYGSEGCDVNNMRPCPTEAGPNAPEGYACWPGATDYPRCFPILTDLNEDTFIDEADCQVLYPDIPGDISAGGDPDGYPLMMAEEGETETPSVFDQPICVPTRDSNYSQGRVFLNLMHQLVHGAGYEGSLGSMRGANLDRPSGTVFTDGSNSFFELMSEHAMEQVFGPVFEISDAFHTVSTESFYWLDETTDVHSHAEVMRIPRGSFGGNDNWTYSSHFNGHESLTFGTDVDVDSYLLMGDRDATYHVQVNVAWGMDVCLLAYDWVSNDLLDTSDGCTDGAEWPDGHAELDIEMPNSQTVVLHLVSLVGSGGAYTLMIGNDGDDYPDTLSSYATAQPLGFNMPANGGHDADDDLDIFRYDAPLGQSGDITFAVADWGDPPNLLVYASVGDDQPVGPTVASGTGSVTVENVTAGTRYYLVVAPVNWYHLTSYQVTVRQDGCGAEDDDGYECNDRGTFDSPRPLPHPIGGSVWNALEAHNPGNEAESLSGCVDGTECDWYGVELLAGQRVTATIDHVYDAECELELAVFAPEEQEHWQHNVGRSPAMVDADGGLYNGSVWFRPQLSFVARRAGTHRLRVRARGDDCPRYQMTVATGAFDEDQPPPTPQDLD